MKSISTAIFLVFIVNISFTQNIDKLTLKGGIRLGVPINKSTDITHIRRSLDWYPDYKGQLNYNNTLNVYAGAEYFPWKIKLSETGTYLLPFTSLNFYINSENTEYKLEDFNNNNYSGQYVIRSFVSGMAFGVKLAFEQYKLDLQLSTDALFINYFHKSKLVKYEFDTDASFFINSRFRNPSSHFVRFVRPYSFNLDLRYKLNDFFSANLGFTPVFFYEIYHQISFGVTYQLLSHKRKAKKNTE